MKSENEMCKKEMFAGIKNPNLFPINECIFMKSSGNALWQREDFEKL